MSVKRNVVANFLGQGWTALMGIVFLPFYIQYLGMEAYGLIGLFITLQACLIVLDLGFSQTLNREMARFKAGKYTSISIKNLLRSVEYVLLFMATIIFLLVWGSSDFIAYNWLKAENISSNTISNAVIFMGAIIALRPLELIYLRSLLGIEKQVAANMITGLASLTRFGGALLILSMVNNSIVAFFMWQLAASIISLLMLMIFTYYYLPKNNNNPVASLLSIRRVWKFAIGMSGISLLAIMMTQFDKILLSGLLSLEVYGHYILSWTVASSTLLLALPISQAYYPKFVDLVANKKDVGLCKLYHQGSQMVSLLVGSFAVILLFFRNDIVFLWTGDAELASNVSPILLPLVLGCFLNCLVWMPYQIQLAYGWTRFGLWVNLVGVIFILPAIYIFTPMYGGVGAAWIWVLLNLGYVSVGMHFMFKKLLRTEKRTWYVEDILKPMAYIVSVVIFFRATVYVNLESELTRLLFYIVVWFISVAFAVFMSSTLRPLMLNMFLPLIKTK